MKALKELNLDNVVFLDIETVNLVPKLEKGTPLWDSWEYKQKYSRDKTNPEDDLTLSKMYDDSGALYPEFAKICAISIGKIKNNVLHVKNYYGEDECKLLTEFTNAMNGILASNKNTVICGHCIKGFDLPFIVRRSIVNKIEPAYLCDPGTSKPWESTSIDIFEIWKGTSFNSASLLNIAVALGLSSPKDDIKGYQVAETYWSKEEGRLERIAKYCSKDVLCTANILLSMMLKDPIDFGEKPVEETKEIPLLTKLFNGAKYTIADAKILTKEYAKLDEPNKERMVILLRSIVDKNSNFTEDNIQAIINFKPKTK